MSEIQKVTTPGQRFMASMNKISGIIQDVLPGRGSVKSFMGRAFIYAQHKPDILNCNEKSLMNALLCCAQTGLALDPRGNMAHIIPYWSNKEGCKIANLIIGYQGYIDLMYRCAKVVDVNPQIVYQGDDFDYDLGTNAHIVHRPHWLNLRSDGKGAPVEVAEAAYCILTFENGMKKFEVMHKYDIERIRDTVKYYDPNDAGHMWNKHWRSMWKKTVIRAMVKYVPHAPEMAFTLDMDRRAGEGLEQKPDVGIAEEIKQANTVPTKAQALEEQLVSSPAEWGAFGARLSKYRVDAGISTENAAVILKLTDAQLFDLESGGVYLPSSGDPSENLIDFAMECGINPADILELLPT